MPNGQEVKLDFSKAQPLTLDFSKAQPIDKTFVGPGRFLRAAPKTFSKEWWKQQLVNAEDAFTEGLPAAGATVGGILGGGAGLPGGPVAAGAGAVSGAGIGGMAGEAGKQLIRRALGFESPQTPEEAAGRITKEGLQQATVEAATAGLGQLATPFKGMAARQFERALAPTTRANKAIARKITPEMIRRGEAGSLERLEKRAGEKIAELNPQLSTVYGQGQGAGKIAGSGDQVIADLEKVKQSYMPEGVNAQPHAVNAIEGVQNVVRQYGADISPNTLRRLRQIFEEAPAQRGAYAGADLSTNYTLNAQKEAADSIRGILNKNPDIGALNKEISFWLDVQRVTRDSALRRTGQEGGLLKTLAPLGSAVVGGGAGVAAGANVGVEAGALTFLTVQLAKAMRTPTWRTVTALGKDRLANAIARGDVRAAMGLLARYGLVAIQDMPPPSALENHQSP